MDSNENISKELDLICSKCGNENSNFAKFCDKCGEQLLDNISFNLNENKLSEEKILGKIFGKNFKNRIIDTSKFVSVFFTTDRILVITTIHLKSMKWGFIPIKKAVEIHNELIEMTPDEIFSSKWPCTSIPYSEIEMIKIKKGTFNPGYFKITAAEFKDKIYIYSTNASPLKKPSIEFLDELKPILGDKLKVKR